MDIHVFCTWARCLALKMAARHRAPTFGDMALSSLGCRITRILPPSLAERNLKENGTIPGCHGWMTKCSWHFTKAKNVWTHRSCKGGWYDMVLPYTKTIEVGARQIWSVEVFLSSELHQKRKKVHKVLTGWIHCTMESNNGTTLSPCWAS